MCTQPSTPDPGHLLQKTHISHPSRTNTQVVSYVLSVRMTRSPEPALDAHPQVDAKDIYVACGGRPRTIKGPAGVPTCPSLQRQILPASPDLAPPHPLQTSQLGVFYPFGDGNWPGEERVNPMASWPEPSSLPISSQFPLPPTPHSSGSGCPAARLSSRGFPGPRTLGPGLSGSRTLSPVWLPSEPSGGTGRRRVERGPESTLSQGPGKEEGVCARGQPSLPPMPPPSTMGAQDSDRAGIPGPLGEWGGGLRSRGLTRRLGVAGQAPCPHFL